MTGKMISKEFFLEMISDKALPQIEQIEEFTHSYPWCALGHKMLFKVLCTQSDEAYLSYASKASAYLFNKEELFALAHTPRPFFSTPSEPFVIKEQTKEEKPQEKASEVIERIVIVGGDYFTQTVLDSASFEEMNPIDRFIKTNPKLSPVQLFQEEQEEKVSLLNVGEDNFMTETLAKIYADQSLYQLAIEAYKKLILLYPKKSDYFAALIKDIKSKMNR